MHKEAAKLKKKKGEKYTLTLRWTARHFNIPGNNVVDEEAKKVAEGLTSEATPSPKIMKIQETADDQQICGKAEAIRSD